MNMACASLYAPRNVKRWYLFLLLLLFSFSAITVAAADEDDEGARARAGFPDRYRSGRFLRPAVGSVAYTRRLVADQFFHLVGKLSTVFMTVPLPRPSNTRQFLVIYREIVNWRPNRQSGSRQQKLEKLK